MRSQKEQEINCKYTNNIKIYQLNLTKDKKVNELMQTEDPVIVLEADVEQTKSEYRTCNDRLRNLEEKYKHCIETITKQNDTISLLENDLQEYLLYPLIIRELIKQSR